MEITTQNLASSSRHVIHFSGLINQQSTYNIWSIFLQAMQGGAASILFRFSSEGGDLNSGFALYNNLRSVPIPIEAHNIGSVESIATLVYLAADTRKVVEHGRFLIHSFNANFSCLSVDFGRLSERARSIDNYGEIYAKIFDERTQDAKTPINVLDALKGEALIIDASTAASSGVASGMVTPEDVLSISDTHWWASP